jgi:hypothetical protein
MAAVVVAMAAEASAAKARPAKSALHARVDAVVKAESKAVKAKPAPHAASDQSVVNAVSAASAQAVIALPVKAVVMAVRAHAVTTWLKASAPTA